MCPLVNQEHEHQPTMMECIQELIDTGVLDKKDIVRLKKEIDEKRNEVAVLNEMICIVDRLDTSVDL